MVEMRYFDKYAQLIYTGKIRVCKLTMKSIRRSHPSRVRGLK